MRDAAPRPHTDLTRTQRAHLRALSADWRSAGDLRRAHGFCNATSLLSLRRAKLVEYERRAGRGYDADRDDHWRLTVAGLIAATALVAAERRGDPARAEAA